MICEQKALKASILLETLFGVLGLAVACHSDSAVLFIDGAYSTLCIFIMMANVRVARLAAQPTTRLKPYGSAALEPLSIILHALLIILLCTVLITVSCYRLLNGGYIPVFSSAALYECFSVVAGIGMTAVFYRLSNHQSSPILKIEYQEWLVDTALSITALMAFIIGLLLTPQHAVTPYLDPAMTLLITLVLIRFPLKTLMASIRELTLREPPLADITAPIEQSIEQTATDSQIKLTGLRMIKVGRWLWLDIEVDCSPGMSVDTLANLQYQARCIVGQHCEHYRVQVLFPESSSQSAQGHQNH